jgi:hypothetical protein
MKFTRSIFAVICVSPLVIATGQAQTPPVKSPRTVVTVGSMFSSYPDLEKQAREIGDTWVRKNFERFAALTYPKLIQMLGGKTKFINAMKNEMKWQEAQGLETLSQTPTDVTQFLKVSGSLYALMPTTLRLKMRGELFESYGCMLGISSDGGTHWTFLEPAGKRLKDLVPEVADKLTLCPEKPPVKLSSG